ncbi:MAG: tyrosine-type recombinase/integrase [Synergistaceae bacterium]|jgi:integrase|nr:tyrosine-type recombinase/integrase [Synergistaceae bacterium]
MEVDPIKEVEKIAEMKKVLKERRKRERNTLLFVMGINTALRIGDLLTLSVGDVLGDKGQILKTMELKERKTGKTKRFPINDSINNALSDYLEKRRIRDRSEPLFLSQKGERLSRSQAWRIMKTAGESAGLENIGTHSLRKTFGYHVYKKTGGDLGLVQKLLNHSASGVTLKYIGIDKERLDNTYLELNL